MGRPHPLAFSVLNYVCCICLQAMPPRPRRADVIKLPETRLHACGGHIDIVVGMHLQCAQAIGPHHVRAVIAEATRQLMWEARAQLN